MKSYKTFCENINGRFFLKYACTAVKLVCYSMHFSIWKRDPLLFLNIVISIMTRSPRIIHNENGENSAYEFVLLSPETKEQRTVTSSTYVVVLLHRCYKLLNKHFVYIRLLVFIWSSRRG